MQYVRSLDTTSQAHTAQMRVYRAMGPTERSRASITMSKGACAVSDAGIRTRHPEYDEDDVEWAGRRLRLGDELFRRAWPHAPLLDP